MKKRRSRLDPYKDQITDWSQRGVTATKMADMLLEETGELFSEQMIYTYIYKHGLRYRPWKDVYEARNKCNDCEYCHKYINTNYSQGRICTLSWRTIQSNVINSPVWCEKETNGEAIKREKV